MNDLISLSIFFVSLGALQCHIASNSASRSSLNRSFMEYDEEENSRYTTAIDTTPLLLYHSRLRANHHAFLQDEGRNAIINWRVFTLIFLFFAGISIGGYLICKESECNHVR